MQLTKPASPLNQASASPWPFDGLASHSYHVIAQRRGKDKRFFGNLLLAIDSFPTETRFLSRKKDHNRAEATLIAYHGSKKPHFPADIPESPT
jgi:hypothetical protein